MRIAPSLVFRLTIVTGMLVLLSLPGCASRGRREPGPKTKTSSATPTPAPPIHVLVGDVAIVNEEKGFVLIDLGSNLYVPDPGTALRVVREGVVVAQLKTSPEQKRPFIAADIVEGKPEAGDRVER